MLKKGEMTEEEAAKVREVVARLKMYASIQGLNEILVGMDEEDPASVSHIVLRFLNRFIV
jgi:hypothetical protein